MARKARRTRLVLDVPGLLLERLRFVRLLDGRSAAEWCRATLAEGLGRLLVERPGWAWARPGAPWWREGRASGAPAGALAGGERVMVLAVLGEVLPADVDEDEGGTALLVDVVPADEGPAGLLLRRVVVRSSDVLPWRKRRGEGLAAGSPGAAACVERAAAAADRRRAAGAAARSSPVDVDPSSV